MPLRERDVGSDRYAIARSSCVADVGSDRYAIARSIVRKRSLWVPGEGRTKACSAHVEFTHPLTVKRASPKSCEGIRTGITSCIVLAQNSTSRLCNGSIV